MRRLATATAICVAALGLATPAGARAASTAPAWTIEAVPFPSTFAPGAEYEREGPAYFIQAYNIGAASTTGRFTLTDQLPKGLLPAIANTPSGYYGPAAETEREMSCSTLGRRVTCTGGDEGPVGPGEGVSVMVPLRVAASAIGSLEGTVSIEGGGAGIAEAPTPTPIGTLPSPFGFIAGPGLQGAATEADGSPAALTGSHPYQAVVAGMNLATGRNGPQNHTLLAAGGGLREAIVSMPHGMVVNPAAVPKCTEPELESEETGCPEDSQVGVVSLALSLAYNFGTGPSLHALYNMVPPPGYPASFGFEVAEGIYVHLLGSVSSDGSFTLSARSKDILSKVTIGGIHTTLWGDPSAESHDGQRGRCLYPTRTQERCPLPERAHMAFLTMPSACGAPLATTVAITSWLGDKQTASYTEAQSLGDCASLPFEPSISARPTTTRADSPSGLEFDLTQAQREGYAERANAPLKDTTVTLPEGMVLNPSAANGREACTAAEVGLTSAVGATPIRWREEAAHCPDASKVGTATVTTPLLDHPLAGAVYLAKPFENPFGSLLALYLVVEDEETGIIAKLAGRVEADPVTGRLTTSFSESPQLPLSDVHLGFFGGSRAALTTPLACGQKTVTGALTPWSSSTPSVVSASFQIDSAPGGGTCPVSAAQAPNSPSLSAGTTDPLAGAYSPFVLKLSRPDGSQRISAIDTVLPEGLTGRLAGIPYCPEAAIAQAASRSHTEEGKLEQQSPSCPAASEVGAVTVAAGSGPDPVHVTGHAYLAGPYKGAPLSMVIVTPAVTGPFDLGVVVTRVALEVDLETAQITAKSDPLPTMLDGIPLDVRSVSLELGRPDFTLNPTDCEASSISATVGTVAGQSSTVANRFAVEGCRRLAFKPKLKLSLKGATRRAGHPALKAVVSFPKKGAYANIARAQVGLPHALFLDQGNLDKVCKQAELKAGTCPKRSIYGHAKAWTPLLEKPLEGPVYLGVGYGHKLPDVVADLNGQIRILLHGRVDTTKHDGIRNTFEVVPDAPVSRFVLQLKGGKRYSLIENHENLCAKKQRASARFRAQNGRIAQLHPRIAVRCKAKKRHKRHHGRGS